MIRLVFFGTDNFSLPSLQALYKDPIFKIVGVVTKPDAASRRGHKIITPAIGQFAKDHNISLYQPTKLSTIASDLGALGADAGALISYGKIIPQSILDIFPYGIINFHPSLLPRYRGPSPIESCLLNGDKETGYSLIKLSAQMDAGDIYIQKSFQVDDHIDAIALYDKFAFLSTTAFTEYLPQIISGQLHSQPQKGVATYCGLIKKDDGYLDNSILTNETAHSCYNRFRAFAKYPRTRLKINGQMVIVTAMQPIDNFSGDAWCDIVPCANNTALHIKQIISPKTGRLITPRQLVNPN